MQARESFISTIPIEIFLSNVLSREKRVTWCVAFNRGSSKLLELALMPILASETLLRKNNLGPLRSATGQDKYKKIKLNLKHKNARSGDVANIGNFVELWKY